MFAEFLNEFAVLFKIFKKLLLGYFCGLHGFCFWETCLFTSLFHRNFTFHLNITFLRRRCQEERGEYSNVS